jgi:uncharacterized protein (DUF1697 family)
VPRYVALLRGINVGGKNKVPMAELRALVDSLGLREVSTFIQSGNVLFTAVKAVAPETLEAIIERELGVRSTVVLRTARQLDAVIAANPFTEVDLSTLHVGFMAEQPPAAAMKRIEAARYAPEAMAHRGRELYLHLPSGMGRAKLPAYLDRTVRIPTTYRNWNTVMKLAELATA